MPSVYLIVNILALEGGGRHASTSSFAKFGIFRNFTAEMDIDDDGLVVDYETLFRRLPAPTGR